MHSSSWWNLLPDGRLAHTPAVTNHHPFKVKSTAAMDMTLRTGLAAAISFALSPYLLLPERMRNELELMAFYKDCTDEADPERVFIAPPRNIDITSRKLRNAGYHPKNAHVELLTFQSPYIALHPTVRDSYARHHKSHRVVAQHWRHSNGRRPTLIFVHGYMVDAFWINSLMFSLRWFYESGYDILLYTLPFHGPRKGPYDLFSGMGYFAHGFAHVNEAMLQSVYDLRIWMNHLEDQGVPSMGVSGLSLGGYISSLAACAEPRLAFVIPNAPVVTPIDMVLEWQPIAWLLRRMMRQQQMSINDLRHMLALHCPLTWQPLLPPDRLLLIAGAGDRFTAPHFVNLLHQHWQGSDIHWFPGNHVVHLHQADYLRLMKQFMDRCCDL